MGGEKMADDLSLDDIIQLLMYEHGFSDGSVEFLGEKGLDVYDFNRLYKVLDIPLEDKLGDVERRTREKEFKKLRLKFFVGLFLGLIIFLGSMPDLFTWIPAPLNNFFILWINFVVQIFNH